MKTREAFGFCSNFSKHEVSYNGAKWRTSEHAYQAEKFLDPVIQKRIWEAPSAWEAAQIGRSPELPVREDWDKPAKRGDGKAIVRVKDYIMYEIVLAKFTQNKGLGMKLLESGDAYLYEDTSNTGDEYWGEVSPGVGENRLGHILMKVRAELRSAKERSEES